MSLGNLSDTLSDAQDYKGQLFWGTVVNDQDPTGAGRFQASVPGLFEDGELPWIGRIRESLFGIGPDYGTFGTPHRGSGVIIELQNGDANYPICVGFYPKAEDIPEVFKNGRVWGYRDPSGTTLVVNPDTKMYEFVHASGTKYSIDESGNLVAEVMDNTTLTVHGNAIVHIHQNAELTVGGNATLAVSGSAQVSSGGPATVAAPEVTIDSPETNLTGSLNVDGVISGNSGLRIKGSAGGGTAFFEGDVYHTSGNFSSNGIVLHTHDHVESVGPPV